MNNYMKNKIKYINQFDKRNILLDKKKVLFETEIRDKIKASGIEVCHCAEFKDSVWLDYSGVNGVHGVGYYDEEVGTKSVQEELDRFAAENKDIVYCKDVNEFITKTKNYDSKTNNRRIGEITS